MNRITAAVVILLATNSMSAQQRKPVTVQILAINDFHGNLEPPIGSDGLINGTPAGGAEYLATHIKKARRENPNTVFVSAGDVIGASPLLSALSADKPTIESMNAMHLDLSTVGNHELDHGASGFTKRTAAAKFRYLAANVIKDGPPKSTLRPSTYIRTIGGVKIGFIGETTVATPNMLIRTSSKGLSFPDEATVANEEATKLERMGVHAIVLIDHSGGFQHPPKGSTADTNGCENFTGEIKEIAEKLSPSIKVVISAHTHVFYNCQIAGHTVTSASSYGRMFTTINLSIDPKTDTILDATAMNHIVTRDVPKDAAQTAILNAYRPKADKIVNHVEGSISGNIPRRENEVPETPLGDVLADAQLAATSAADKGGAVIAFMNNGGIRADLTMKPDGSGQITYGDLYRVQPFGNRLTVFTLTGDMLRRLLEQQFRGETTHFMQVSASLNYQYKLHASNGEHIVPRSIKLNGRPISPDEKLRIEASDFMAAGAEGFTVFREQTDTVDGPLDVDALVAYFNTHSPVAPPSAGRFVRVD